MAFEAFLNSLELGGGGGDFLKKVGVFVLVQLLVYLILTKSSNIFSTSSSLLRSLSFPPVRTASFRRMLASLSDVPAGSDDPSSANPLAGSDEPSSANPLAGSDDPSSANPSSD